MATVVVSGALANRCHNGGGAWVRLNWLLGLQRLGHDVYFIEQIPLTRCVDRWGNQSFADSVNGEFFQAVLVPFGLAERSALICENGTQIHGMTFPQILDLAERADLLINLGGHLTCQPILSRFCRKAYIDLDPGFTQIWQTEGNAGARLAGHDLYFTVGTNISTPHCPIPTAGIAWRGIRPPIVLHEWPAIPHQSGGSFTTVASWRGPFGPLQLGGKTLGLKVHEFRKFLDLPEQTRRSFEIALDIHPDEDVDLAALTRNGWRFVDPRKAAGDPAAYRRYVQSSLAEFSPAQGVYVATGSGWFSDRTAAYLASAKPALVQDTGFTGSLPSGEGLIGFRTKEEAVAGINEIGLHYDRHCDAARALAEACFDSDKVLRRFLDEVGLLT